LLRLPYRGQHCLAGRRGLDYSVRSVQLAVYQLLKLDKEPPALYKGQHEVKVLYHALKTMHR
jgi:oleate hydratase